MVISEKHQMTGKVKVNITDEEYQKAAKSVVSDVIRSFFLSGAISKEDIENGSAVEKVAAIFKENKDKIKFVSDHTETIIKKARRERIKFPEEAILHYALYVEHQINRLIVRFCDRNDIDQSVSLGLMRELKLSSKATWALQLIGGEAFDDATVKKIKRLSDERNAYAHYKWSKGDPDNDQEKLELRKKFDELFSDAENIVNKIKSYENITFYHGKRSKIIKSIANR